MQGGGGPALWGCWQGGWRWFPFTLLLCVSWVCPVSITAYPGVIYPPRGWDQLLPALPAVPTPQAPFRASASHRSPRRSWAAAGQWSPFSAAWSGIPAGTGPSPAPSTGFPYLCWPLAQTRDERADWVVSVRWCGGEHPAEAAQPPSACMGASLCALALHPAPGVGEERPPPDQGNEGVQDTLLGDAFCPLRDKTRQQGLLML